MILTTAEWMGMTLLYSLNRRLGGMHQAILVENP